jgi:hypothetical protein
MVGYSVANVIYNRLPCSLYQFGFYSQKGTIMSNAYHVPTTILADQARKTFELYKQDNDENRSLLSSIGLNEADFEKIDNLGAQIMEIEGAQEEVKADSELEQLEASEAIQELIDWRGKKLLPRVKIAFVGDKRLRHFRPGKLRSLRPATVVRECKLLVDAILRFSKEPEMVLRGITEEMANEGKMLIEKAEKEDLEAAAAHMHQIDTTEKLYDLEDELDDLLSDVEKCAAAIFDEESAALKRYRMNEIRNYIAVMHNSGSDKTATADVPDPAPATQPAPVQ